MRYVYNGYLLETIFSLYYDITGLAAAGYTSVNLDDCEWRSKRNNATGAVVLSYVY